MIRNCGGYKPQCEAQHVRKMRIRSYEVILPEMRTLFMDSHVNINTVIFIEILSKQMGSV